MPEVVNGKMVWTLPDFSANANAGRFYVDWGVLGKHIFMPGDTLWMSWRMYFPSSMIKQPYIVSRGKGGGGTLSVTVAGGGLSSCSIVNAGQEYSSTRAPLVYVGGPGTGGKIAVAALNGALNTCTITASGSGYTTVPVTYVYVQQWASIKHWILDPSGGPDCSNSELVMTTLFGNPVPSHNDETVRGPSFYAMCVVSDAVDQPGPKIAGIRVFNRQPNDEDSDLDDGFADNDPCWNKNILSDGSTDPAPVSGCWIYPADQWATYTVRLQITNTTCAGCVPGRPNKTAWRNIITLWVKPDGSNQQKIIDSDFYSIESDHGKGMVVWEPFMTDKDKYQDHPQTFWWVDELIISTQCIPMPGGSCSGGVPN